MCGCMRFTEAGVYGVYGNVRVFNKNLGFIPYIISVISFAIIATIFTLGNIEDSIGLQLIIVTFRLLFL